MAICQFLVELKQLSPAGPTPLRPLPPTTPGDRYRRRAPHTLQPFAFSAHSAPVKAKFIV